jgi:hypothetical protein
MPTIAQRFRKLFRLEEQQTSVSNESVQKVQLHMDPIGSSGTSVFSGYYSEEYLNTLTTVEVADVWDKMRRSDPKIKMILQAVKNPIKSAKWFIDPADQTDEAKKQAALIEKILFKDCGQAWTQTLSEILTFIEFGYSLFEVTHKVILNDPEFGSYNSLQSLGWRSPKTIWRWILDPKTGKLVSVEQQADGDLQRHVLIPSEFILTFVLDKEGDNYQGISALRPCFGAWKRKNDFLKLMAIGTEKFAVPTPILTVPAGKEASPEFAKMRTILEKWVSHERQYITKPQGWEIEFTQTNFDTEKVQSAINAQNVEMVHAFLCNFLELGQSGSGSYALSNDLSDFFLAGIEHLANLVCEQFNNKLIPDLIKLNYGNQMAYPVMKVAGIKDKPGKELAEIMKLLIDGKVIKPDDVLEANFREKYGLPAADTASQRDVEPLSPQAFSELMAIEFADKPKTPYSLIRARAPELKELMDLQIESIGQAMISKLVSKYKDSTPTTRARVTADVEPKGFIAYRTAVEEFLANLSDEAIAQARKDVPGGSKIKLADIGDLPKALQARIKQMALLMSTADVNDLTKVLLSSAAISSTSTDSATLFESDLDAVFKKFKESSARATSSVNLSSQIVNESRGEFFFSDEVKEQIESFTFTNPDPVSPICQDLVGTTFSKDDPNIDRYTPPLHHNCKSYLAVNLTGSGKEIEALKPSKSSLDKFITLADPGMIAVYAIDVSKKVASTGEEAKTLASTITDVSDQSPSENEMKYRLEFRDIATMDQGSLKSFEAMEGIVVYYGRLLPDQPSPVPVTQASERKRKAKHKN